MKLKKLKNSFYSKYNKNSYPNILRKNQRSYYVYEIKLKDKIHCIPIKTNIKHSSCFLFKNSSRKKNNEKPGLDFKHTVILKDENYIGEDGHIDNAEYKFLSNNEDQVVAKYLKFINGYKKYVQNPINKFWESWRYLPTSLEYFWEELDIKILDVNVKQKEIQMAFMLYILVTQIAKDTQTDFGYYHINRLSTEIVSLSFNGIYIIKRLEYTNINDYIELNIISDENENKITKYLKKEKYYNVCELVKDIKKNQLNS